MLLFCKCTKIINYCRRKKRNSASWFCSLFRDGNWPDFLMTTEDGGLGGGAQRLLLFFAAKSQLSYGRQPGGVFKAVSL